MNKSRKTTVLILIVAFTLTCCGKIGAMAIGDSEIQAAYNEGTYPLVIDISSDKASYSAYATENFVISIKNIGAQSVTSVNSSIESEELELVKDGNIPYEKNITIEAGKSTNYRFSTMLNSEKADFISKFILTIKKLFKKIVSFPVLKRNGNNTVEQIYTVKVGKTDAKIKVFVSYKYSTDIVNSKDEKDFVRNVNALIEKSDVTEGCRIIADCDNFGKTDFAKFNAEEIVIGNDGIVVMQFADSKRAIRCVDALNKTKGVNYAEKEVLFETQEIEESTYSATVESNWGIDLLNCDRYSSYASANNYSKLVTVAVVDSGVDKDHPYYKGKILSSGYDFVDSDSDPDDMNGHGTHVAGIVTSCTPNLNIKIMPVRVLDEVGAGSSIIVGAGINYAVNNGAKVINLSLSGDHSKFIDEAVENAIKKDVTVCVAAGNNAADTSESCPSHIDDVIVVSAISGDKKLAYYSNSGKEVDLCAPGTGVYSSYKNGSYKTLTGTSMAAPFVSAACALIRLTHPTYKNAEVENLLKTACVDLGPAGKDTSYGYGYPDLYRIIPDVTVYFNTNGGTSCTSKTVKSGETVVLPFSSKTFTVTLNANGGTINSTNYAKSASMAGWFNNSSLSGIRYEPGDSYVVLGNQTQTLYAGWTLPKLGSVAAPAKTNHRFTGWFTSATGGTQYTALSDISSNITLYAHWEVLTSKVPNLIGQSYTSARDVLKALNLNVNLVSRYNHNVNANVVFEQSVAAGTTVNQGSTITITYSLGTKPFTVGDNVEYYGQYLYGYVPNGNPRDVTNNSPRMIVSDIYYYGGVQYLNLGYYSGQKYGWVPASAVNQVTD